MTKTPEQIRLEAERRYPLYSDDITYYAANNIRQHQRQAFIAACHWLQSEQGEVICKCGHPANRHCIAECSHTGAKSEPRCLVCDCECFTPTPPQGEEAAELKWMLNDAKVLNERLTAELTALRSQLSEAQENYEKVWDAAIKRDYYEKYSAMELWQHLEIPPDKTTFINNLKKGKE
jgi:hypothetical protein